MVSGGALLGVCIVSMSLSVLAVAYTFLTRRSEWPGLALQRLQEITLRLESLEQSWRSYKIGMDETLEATDQLRARTETARKRAAASESRQRSREGGDVPEEGPTLSPAQQANALWRQRKAGR